MQSDGQLFVVDMIKPVTTSKKYVTHGSSKPWEIDGSPRNNSRDSDIPTATHQLLSNLSKIYMYVRYIYKYKVCGFVHVYI